jgi:hypothetical protein
MVRIDYILTQYEELDENEVIADVRGIKPKMLNYTYDTGRIIYALMHTKKIHPSIEELPNYETIVRDFREFVR